MPNVSGWVTPYKIDVRQGNYVTQEMVSQLKQGMTRDQVRYALGTPLLVDVFHKDRWDYVYRYQEGSGKVEERRITVFFDEQGKLAKLAGDVVAAPAATAGAAAPANKAGQVVEISMSAEAKAAADAAAAAPKPATAEGKPWWRSLWPF